MGSGDIPVVDARNPPASAPLPGQGPIPPHRSEARAWEAALQASDALDAVHDALFVVEEMRQEHAALWDAPRAREAGRSNTGTLLLSLDEAVGRLVAAQGLCTGRMDQARALDLDADLAAQWAAVHAHIGAALAELRTDRLLIVLHDVCAQAHRLMDSLESALAQNTGSDEAGRVFETRRAHYVPACRRVLTVLTKTAPACTAPRPHVQPHVDAVHARWAALEPRLDAPPPDLAHAMQTLSLTTPRRPREKRRARDSDVERRWSAGTPSKLPRTPTHVPPVPPLPHGVRTEPRMGRSVSAAVPPRAPRAADAVPERPRPGSVLETRSPSTPGMYYRPPHAPPSGKLRRRESMLPRLTTPSDDRPPTPGSRLPRTPGGLRHRASSAHLRGSDSPSVGRATRRYQPSPYDALDIGVARICNARQLAVEHVDGGPDDEYHRYTLLSKTVACRLLHTVCRPTDPAPSGRCPAGRPPQDPRSCRRRLARARAVDRRACALSAPYQKRDRPEVCVSRARGVQK